MTKKKYKQKATNASFSENDWVSTPIRIFESSNVDGTTDTDNCKGAVFSQDALGLAMMQDLKLETQRDASLRADEIVATAVYGVSEIHDSYGVKLTADTLAT